MCFRSGAVFGGDSIPVNDTSLIQPPASIGRLHGNPTPTTPTPAAPPPSAPFSLLCGGDGSAAPLLSSLTFLVDNATRGIQVHVFHRSHKLYACDGCEGSCQSCLCLDVTGPQLTCGLPTRAAYSHKTSVGHLICRTWARPALAPIPLV